MSSSRMTQRSRQAPRWAVRDEGQREGWGLCFCGWVSGLRPPSVPFYFICYDFCRRWSLRVSVGVMPLFVSLLDVAGWQRRWGCPLCNHTAQDPVPEHEGSSGYAGP